MANDRFDARSQMIRKVSLSAGARLLYMLLDDMARDRGNWFIKQARMAAEIGCTDREVRTRVQELVTGGYVRSERHGSSSTYFLAWADRNARSALEASEDEPRSEQAFRSDRNRRSALESPYLITVLSGTNQGDDATSSAERDDAAVVLGHYASYTGNTPREGDRQVARELASVEVLAVQAGILLSVMRSRTPVRSLRYCAGAIREASAAGIGQMAEYVRHLEGRLSRIRRSA